MKTHEADTKRAYENLRNAVISFVDEFSRGEIESDSDLRAMVTFHSERLRAALDGKDHESNE